MVVLGWVMVLLREIDASLLGGHGDDWSSHDYHSSMGFLAFDFWVSTKWNVTFFSS